VTALSLAGQEPLFVGGTRLVFQHPAYEDRCIKVLRPERSGAARRARQRGWKRWRPAAAFDDQRKEIRAYRQLIARSRDIDAVWNFVPQYFGTVETDRGLGIVTRLFRNDDGSWPRNLEQRLPRGLSAPLARGLTRFAEGVRHHAILTRDLLPHNLIVVSHADGEQQVIVVDGIGSADFLPVAEYWPAAARAKVARKLTRLEARLRMLMPLRDQETFHLCSS
jgi:hypothetical protein